MPGWVLRAVNKRMFYVDTMRLFSSFFFLFIIFYSGVTHLLHMTRASYKVGRRDDGCVTTRVSDFGAVGGERPTSSSVGLEKPSVGLQRASWSRREAYI